MDWDNEQIFHWLTAVGLGEYVQVLSAVYRFDQSVSNLISIFYVGVILSIYIYVVVPQK